MSRLFENLEDEPKLAHMEQKRKSEHLVRTMISKFDAGQWTEAHILVAGSTAVSGQVAMRQLRDANDAKAAGAVAKDLHGQVCNTVVF